VRAAGQVQQLGTERLDPGLQVTLQGADALGDGVDVVDVLAGEAGLQTGLQGCVLLAQQDADPGEVGGSVQGAGGDVEVGVEVVQGPAQPVDQPGALGDEMVTVVDQQLGARG
jgi:hypothetical protein